MWPRKVAPANDTATWATKPAVQETTKMTPEEFRAAREAAGFTQSSLAAHWDMGKNGARSIRRWEAGSVPVNPIAAHCIRLMLDMQAAAGET